MIRAVEDDDVLRDEATSESTRVFQRGKRGEAGTRGKKKEVETRKKLVQQNLLTR